jgi:hypothetical protein
MFVVALLALHGPADEEARALAGDLGVTAYEAGQRVRGALPSVVFRDGDVERAKAIARAMHERGNQVVLLDAAQVPPGEHFPRLKTFRLTDEALVAVHPTGAKTALRFADVVALVAAVHRGEETRTEVTRERKFSLVRAALTQGLSVSKTVETASTHAVTQKEPVLYLFHRGGPAWLLTETGCRYDGLGSHVRPTRPENFQVLVRLMRERCTQAPFDDRLVRARHTDGKVTADFTGHTAAVSSAASVHLLAHVVASALLRSPRS